MHIISRSKENSERNRRMEAIERKQSQPPRKSRVPYRPVGTIGDLTIKEGEAPSGAKMTVINDANTKKDKKAKAKYIRNTYGDNPTKNGHGTVVTVGDAE